MEGQLSFIQEPCEDTWTPKRAHCLFEQSGTFKNEFKKLGVEAFDYDIRDDFGETDFQKDLFAEIENAYDGKASIFDNFTEYDVIMSFFPCVRFEDCVAMFFRGTHGTTSKWPMDKQIEFAMQLENERHHFYQLFCKMVLLAMRGGKKMVIENPYSAQHYLTQYFPCRPKLIDKNRRDNGDYFVKPTQYWFINFEPKRKMLFDPIPYQPKKTIYQTHNQVKRSLISPLYANRFIREQIL